MCKMVDMPGMGKIPERQLRRAISDRLHTLFTNLTEQRLYPFKISGRTVEYLEVAYNEFTLTRFDDLFEIIKQKRMNPLLLESVFSIVENNLLPLWDREQAEVYCVDLAKVSCLQKSGATSGLTFDRLREVKIVLTRKVEAEEIEASQKKIAEALSRARQTEEVAAAYKRDMLAIKEKTGQGFLDFTPLPRKP